MPRPVLPSGGACVECRKLKAARVLELELAVTKLTLPSTCSLSIISARLRERIGHLGTSREQVLPNLTALPIYICSENSKRDVLLANPSAGGETPAVHQREEPTYRVNTYDVERTLESFEWVEGEELPLEMSLYLQCGEALLPPPATEAEALHRIWLSHSLFLTDWSLSALSGLPCSLDAHERWTPSFDTGELVYPAFQSSTTSDEELSKIWRSDIHRNMWSMYLFQGVAAVAQSSRASQAKGDQLNPTSLKGFIQFHNSKNPQLFDAINHSNPDILFSHAALYGSLLVIYSLEAGNDAQARSEMLRCAQRLARICTELRGHKHLRMIQSSLVPMVHMMNAIRILAHELRRSDVRGNTSVSIEYCRCIEVLLDFLDSTTALYPAWMDLPFYSEVEKESPSTLIRPYLYYKLFHEGLPLFVREPIDSENRAIGRINRIDISPPYTLDLVETAVRHSEGLEVCKVKVYEDGSAEPLGNNQVFSFRSGSLGVDATSPIIVVLLDALTASDRWFQRERFVKFSDRMNKEWSRSQDAELRILCNRTTGKTRILVRHSRTQASLAARDRE
ncbi:hypothetical protein DL93DRAFT_2098457 [Clavulina sp. PMI_390]|nr:hypothetical protein DL93DRAFT_2098457 [Clavulina sp. PMI_390]